MNSINFYSGDKFPMHREALAKMQDMTNLVSLLAGMGGQNFILSGCTQGADGKTTDGYVVIQGELLPFTGGDTKSKITIVETRQDVSAQNITYPETYITRVAQFSDSGEYNWADFEQIMSNTELYKLIRDIAGDKPGVVKMWAGMTSQIPADYLLCDGRELAISEYPDLYEVLRTAFGGNGQTSFNLPSLSGRFVVGYNVLDNDYNAISKDKAGGSKTVALEEANLAAHKHIVPWGENKDNSFVPPWGYAKDYDTGQFGTNSTDRDNAWYNSSPVGEGKPFDIRPPYLVLAYIIKVK